MTSTPLHTHSPWEPSNWVCHSHTRHLSPQQDPRIATHLSTVMFPVCSAPLAGLGFAAIYLEGLLQMDGRGSMRPHNVIFLMHVHNKRAIFPNKYMGGPLNQFMADPKKTHSPMKSFLSLRFKLGMGMSTVGDSNLQLANLACWVFCK